MKKLVFALGVFALLAGCRRTDVRDFTVEFSALTEADRTRAVEAFLLPDPYAPGKSRCYDGVDTGSFVFDFGRKTLTMKYDSMKIAHTNIRMLLEAKGLPVVYPTNTTGRAGH